MNKISKIAGFFFEIPVFTHVEAPKSCVQLAWLFSIVAVSTVCGFLFVPLSNVYFATAAVCLVYLIQQGGITWDRRFMALFLAFGISALLATEPLFNSRMRFGLFVLMSLVSSPCMQSDMAVKFRALVTRNVILLFSILVVGTFACYFLGVNYMAYSIQREDLIGQVHGQAGSFSGLFAHSMQMGPLAAITALMFFAAYQAEKKKIYIALFCVSMLTTVLSASRGSTMALFLPIAYSLLFSKSRGKVAITWLLAASAILAIPLADEFSEGLVEKQQSNVIAGGTFYSRESKWESRIDEFNSSPIYGVGFCAVDTRHVGDYNDDGGIEPGSSHLSVLSMTGILGFVPYVLIILAAYKAVRRKDDEIANFRLCMFLSCMTYGLAEGHALFGGGFLFLVFWISIAQCMDYERL